MKNMPDQPTTTPFEAEMNSPADKMKEMILDSWKLAEDYFTKGEDILYSRASRSFSRMFFVMADLVEKEILATIDSKEREEIKAIRDANVKQKKSSVITDDEIKKILVEYADLRMETLILMISQSPIIQKDVDVEFVMPQRMEDAEAIRAMVKQKLGAEGKGFMVISSKK